MARSDGKGGGSRANIVSVAPRYNGYSELNQFLNRIPPQTQSQIDNYSNLVNSLVNDGIWDKLDMLVVYAAGDPATALTNIVSESITNTMVSNVTFTSYRGFQPDGVSGYIATNFNPASIAIKYSQDSASLGGWIYSQGSALGAPLIGNESISPSVYTNINTFVSSAEYRMRINTSSGPLIVASTISVGFFAGSRLISTAFVAYINGSPVGTGNFTSSAPAGGVFSVGKANTVGFTNNTISAALIGSGLDDAEHLSLYNSMLTYMQAVGVA